MKDPALLDFETLKVVRFELVAKEMVDVEPKESRVSVTVHIRDRNDNRPEFESSQYVIFVSEALQLGGNVTQIRATDIDSGDFGTSGIRYTSLGGPLAGYLLMDSETGLVSNAPLIPRVNSQPLYTEVFGAIELFEDSPRSYHAVIRFTKMLLE